MSKTEEKKELSIEEIFDKLISIVNSNIEHIADEDLIYLILYQASNDANCSWRSKIPYARMLEKLPKYMQEELEFVARFYKQYYVYLEK